MKRYEEEYAEVLRLVRTSRDQNIRIDNFKWLKHSSKDFQQDLIFMMGDFESSHYKDDIQRLTFIDIDLSKPGVSQKALKALMVNYYDDRGEEYDGLKHPHKILFNKLAEEVILERNEEARKGLREIAPRDLYREFMATQIRQVVDRIIIAKDDGLVEIAAILFRESMCVQKAQFLGRIIKKASKGDQNCKKVITKLLRDENGVFDRQELEYSCSILKTTEDRRALMSLAIA